MIRLYVFAEGETEEAIVNRVLSPHLATRDVFVYARSLGGGSRWKSWRHFMDRQMKQEKGDQVRFTTMFDLYRLPKDFPSSGEHAAIIDTTERTRRFEKAMADDLDHRGFIPYIQRHEVEALVLACLDQLVARFPAARDGIENLRAAVADRSPEDINDGPETHPSQRLIRDVAGYGKVADGPSVIEEAGLPRVRARCPRFDAWLTTLEALAAPGTGQ